MRTIEHIGSLQLQDVLQLVLQHAPDLSTPRNLCRLLQVNRSCRQAVQQSRAHCIIHLGLINSLEQLTVFSRFAAWLPRHAGLVSQLYLSMAPASGFHQLAGQLVSFALQACASAAAAPEPAAAEAVAAAAAAAPVVSAAVPLPARLQDARPPPLHLFRLCADDLIQTPGLLDVLAAFQLQELVLSITPRLLQPSSSAALTNLKCLRALNVTSRGAAVDPWPEAWVVAIGQLQQLTYLIMTNLDPALSGLLPVGLRQLHLQNPFLQPDGGQATTTLDVSHLTALTKLFWWSSTLAVQVLLKLPKHQLSLLEARGNLQLVEPWHIQALVVDDICGLQLLPQLPAQPQPSNLSIRLSSIANASHAEWAQAIAALGRLTALTRLRWQDFTPGDGVQDSIPLCAALLQLTNLSELDVELPAHLANDVMQLSKLASLTGLTLACGPGLTDMAAVALACGLRGLQELYLDCSGLQTWSCLPVIAQLTQLKSLQLWCHRDQHNLVAAFGSKALQQLSSLTGLTNLMVPLEFCPEDCQQQFLANMPLLECIGDGCD